MTSGQIQRKITLKFSRLARIYREQAKALDLKTERIDKWVQEYTNQAARTLLVVWFSEFPENVRAEILRSLDERCKLASKYAREMKHVKRTAEVLAKEKVEPGMMICENAKKCKVEGCPDKIPHYPNAYCGGECEGKNGGVPDSKCVKN